VTRNRDASLLIDDAEAAEYFEKIFLHDWEYLAKASLGPKNKPIRVIDPSSTRGPLPQVPPGYRRMSLADYLDE
jgi:hypothetical protein